MPEHIGGHEGLDVYRLGNGLVMKQATTDPARAELDQEEKCLRALEGKGQVAPPLVSNQDGELLMADAGDEQEPPDGWQGRTLLQGGIKLLYELRQAGIRHGDLTARNIIIRKNRPIAIDFGQAKLGQDSGPTKRPEPDYYHLLSYLRNWDTNRVVDRWLVIAAALSEMSPWTEDPLANVSLVDLGCYDGIFTALACACGMEVHGIDSDCAAVTMAEKRWPNWEKLSFSCEDLFDFDTFKGVRAALLLSTFPYMVQQHGLDASLQYLVRVLAYSTVLFFETQLYGDGPGLEKLHTDQDVETLLRSVGEVNKLGTFHVEGRNAERTVWKVWH